MKHHNTPSEALSVEYDWNATKPSQAILESVSEVLGEHPLELEPLYSVIDPTALDALLTRDDETAVEISFHYLGLRVELEEAGHVTVDPAE